MLAGTPGEALKSLIKAQKDFNKASGARIDVPKGLVKALRGLDNVLKDLNKALLCLSKALDCLHTLMIEIDKLLD